MSSKSRIRYKQHFKIQILVTEQRQSTEVENSTSVKSFVYNAPIKDAPLSTRDCEEPFPNLIRGYLNIANEDLISLRYAHAYIHTPTNTISSSCFLVVSLEDS